MIGNRKFVLTLISLLGYVLILTTVTSIDPLSLGAGMGVILSPMATSNAFENIAKAKKGE